MELMIAADLMPEVISVLGHDPSRPGNCEGPQPLAVRVQLTGPQWDRLETQIPGFEAHNQASLMQIGQQNALQRQKEARQGELSALVARELNGAGGDAVCRALLDDEELAGALVAVMHPESEYFGGVDKTLLRKLAEIVLDQENELSRAIRRAYGDLCDAAEFFLNRIPAAN